MSLRCCQHSVRRPSIKEAVALLILKAFRRFTYVIAHSPTLHSLILQAFRRFAYVIAHSPTLPSLILQPFRRFTYVIAHSPTLPSLYLRHSSFSNTSVASPTSQLILHPFFRLSYVTGFSLTSPGEPPMQQQQQTFDFHKIFNINTSNLLT